MSRKEIHETIKSLAMSQGFYGRLMAGHYGDYESILDTLENEVKPKDALDIVFALEG